MKNQEVLDLSITQVPNQALTSSQTVTPRQLEQQTNSGGGGWTFYLLYSISAAVLGTAVMYGFHACVINEPYDVMRSFVNDSFYLQDGKSLSPSGLDTQWSLVVSLFLAGGIIGSIWIPDVMANRFGRTRSLLYVSLVGFIGSAASFIAPYAGSYVPLMIGRLLAGVHCGITMVILPALLVEVAPVRLRGACGSLNELTLVFGVIFTDLLGLRYILGTKELWQILFLLGTILYLVHVVMLIFAAESPRWLIDQKREEDALRVLRKLRSRSDETEILVEFEETKAISIEESSIQRVSLLDFARSRQLGWPLILSIMLHLTQQLTGIGAVSYYTTDILVKAGLGDDAAKLANFSMGIGDLIATLISTVIVDRIGRRLLMILGIGGMGVSYIFLTIVLVLDEYYAAIAAFFAILFGYSLGPGPIAWFMTAEMFLQGARPLALSICLVVNWTGNLVIGLVFPHMSRYLGDYAFVPFAVASFLCTAFLFAFLPETNSIPVEEVVAKFAPGQPFLQCGIWRREKSASRKASEATVDYLRIPMTILPAVEAAAKRIESTVEVSPTTIDQEEVIMF